MWLKGTVRNVVDFGAFVDIGVKQDGLVQCLRNGPNRFVKSPLDVVQVGDVVDVRVLTIDAARGANWVELAQSINRCMEETMYHLWYQAQPAQIVFIASSSDMPPPVSFERSARNAINFSL